jgi:hypothetical protein
MEIKEKSHNSKVIQIELFNNTDFYNEKEEKFKEEIIQQELFKMLKEELRLKRIKL